MSDLLDKYFAEATLEIEKEIKENPSLVIDEPNNCKNFCNPKECPSCRFDQFIFKEYLEPLSQLNNQL